MFTGVGRAHEQHSSADIVNGGMGRPTTGESNLELLLSVRRITLMINYPNMSHVGQINICMIRRVLISVRQVCTSNR